MIRVSAIQNHGRKVPHPAHRRKWIFKDNRVFAIALSRGLVAAID